jgi:hypothetical protein
MDNIFIDQKRKDNSIIYPVNSGFSDHDSQTLSEKS